MPPTKTRSHRSPGRAVTALTAAVIALGIHAVAQTPQLLLVSNPWPPFTGTDGKPHLALDLVEEATKRFNVSFKTSFVAAGDYSTALMSGRFDGSAAAWKDPDRERLFVYSQPYLENRLMLVGRKGADVSAPTLSALKGRKIAIVSGYSYGNEIEGTGPVFTRSQSEEDSLRRVLDASVEYALMDELVVAYIIERYPKEAQQRLQVGATSLVMRPLHFIVRRNRPDAQSIIDQFNAQLKAMIVDRTYHRLLQVHWIRADVDGDGIAEYVPDNDRPGSTQPKTAYSLFSSTIPITSSEESSQRFYLGGNVYSSWAAVPETYRQGESQQPDPRRSTTTLFTFSW
jgi:polar amino acid transport system substrate-binding protein